MVRPRRRVVAWIAVVALVTLATAGSALLPSAPTFADDVPVHDAVGILLPGDFDTVSAGGWQRTDILQVPMGDHVLKVLSSNGDGSFTRHKTQQDLFTTLAQSPGVHVVTGNFNSGATTSDLATDVALVGGSGWGSIPVAHSYGDGTFNQVIQAPIADFASWAQAPGVHVVTGQFDRDGLTDIALLPGPDTPWWYTLPVAFSKGDGSFRVTNTPLNDFAGMAQAPDVRVVTGDFDKNGLTDIALVRGASTPWYSLPVAFSNGDGTFRVVNSFPPNFPSWSEGANARVVTADFNNDGRTDIALTGVAGWSSIPLALSRGDGTFTEVLGALSNRDFGGWASTPGVRVVPGDFDGDQKTDIALVPGSGSDAPWWYTLPVAHSNGDGTFRVTNQAVGSFISDTAQRPGVQPITGDFNHDGATDIALFGSDVPRLAPVAYGGKTASADDFYITFGQIRDATSKQLALVVNNGGTLDWRNSSDQGVTWGEQGHVGGCTNNPTFDGAPSITSDLPDRLTVVGRARDGSLYLNTFRSDGLGVGWFGWRVLPGSAAGGTYADGHVHYDFISDPVITSWGPYRMDIFINARNTSTGDLALLHTWSTNFHFADGNYTWDGAWETLGTGLLQGKPAAVSWAPGRIDVFDLGAGGMAHKWFDQTVDDRWHGWEDLGAPSSSVHFTGSPGVASTTWDRVDVFARGSDGNIYHRFLENGSWWPWTQLSIPLGMSQAMLAAATPTARSGPSVPYSDIDVLFSLGNFTYSGWYQTVNNYPFPQNDTIWTYRSAGAGSNPAGVYWAPQYGLYLAC